MTIIKIDHIGIAVENINQVLGLFQSLLGIQMSGREETPAQNIAFLPVGDTQLELLEPRQADSPIGKFIERKGEGMHHICFQVDDIEATLQRLANAGIELIDKTPRLGPHGKKIAFVHPRSCHGVLVEFYG
jgi:methylmalonyl-CoA/ethylmalonyl-CoA epimerase